MLSDQYLSCKWLLSQNQRVRIDIFGQRWYQALAKHMKPFSEKHQSERVSVPRLELAALEINTNWRMKYFSNTTLIQQKAKCVQLHEMDKCCYFSFHLPAIQLFISIWEKSYGDIYYSPPHVYIITLNISITIISFARCYYLLLASSSAFMTDSLYLLLIQIWRNLNEHYYYLTSTKTLICEIDADCSPFRLGRLRRFPISV